jgi:hypothetical protein
MDDVTEFLEAAGGETAPDAAAAHDATDITDLFAAAAGLTATGELLATAAVPDEAADEGDLFAADEPADDVQAADEDEDAESLEERIARLEAENAEFLQAKRDAEAEATQASTEAYWNTRWQEVQSRREQALAHLAQRLESAYDKDAVIRDYLPHLLDGYTNDLAAYREEREQAIWQVARKHGAQTYVQEVQREYRLSDADMARIKKYPPEMWESLATDLTEVREADVAPVKQELTTTKGKLTKAQNARKRERLASAPDPGSGRSTLNVARLKERITPDNADQVAGSLFQALGLVR